MEKRHCVVQTSHSGERGSAVLLALGFLILMLVIGLVFMDTAISERHIARNRAGNDQAKSAAEAGVAQAKRLLAANTSPTQVYPPDPFNCDGDDFLGNLSCNFKDCLHLSVNGSELPTDLEYQPFSQYVVWSVDRSGKLDPNYFGRPSSNKLVVINTYPFRPIGASPLDVDFLNLAPAFKKASPAATDFDAWWRFGNAAKPTAWKPYDPAYGLRQLYAAAYPDSQAENLWTTYETWNTAQATFNQAPFFPWTHCSAKGGENLFNTYREDMNGNGILDNGEDLDGNGQLDILPRTPLAALSGMLQGLHNGSNTNRLPADLEAAAESSLPTSPVETAGGLPWLATVKRHRGATGYASYLELVANLKDFTDTDSLPTTNIAIPTSTEFSSIAAIGNADSTQYYYCGTEALPNLSEVSLSFDSTKGIIDAKVEIVNLYPAQFNLAAELANLAAIVEVKWDDYDSAQPTKAPTTRIQKMVVGDWIGTTILASSKTILATNSKLSGLTVDDGDKVTSVHLYLINKAGINTSIANDPSPVFSVSNLNGAALVDASLIDIPAVEQPTTKIGSGKGAGNCIGKMVDSYFTSYSAKTKVSRGTRFRGPDASYYISLKNGAKETMANLITNLGTGWCHQLADSTGKVDPVAAKPKNPTPGTIYYVGTNLYVDNNGGVLIGVASGARKVFFESLDPRNNTFWKYQGQAAFLADSNGFDSIGLANPNWWPSPPIYNYGISTQARNLFKVGDRIVFNNVEYRIHTVPVTADPTGPDDDFYQVVDNVVAKTSGQNLRFPSAYGSLEDAPLQHPIDLGLASDSAATIDMLIPSTAYVRNQAFQSLWEVGAVNRAEPWRTLRTGDVDASAVDGIASGNEQADGSYARGDWPILDELCLNDNSVDDLQDSAWIAKGCPSERAKINPSTDNLEMFRAVLASLKRLSPATPDWPVENYNDAPYDETTGTFDLAAWATNRIPVLSSSQTTSLAQALANRNYQSRGRMAAGISAGLAADASFNSWRDRDIEQILGRMVNLFDTRLRHYEIVSLGRYCQYLEEKGPPADDRVPDDVKSSSINHLILEEDTYKPASNPNARFRKAWNSFR